jgi:hypothetical protein
MAFPKADALGAWCALRLGWVKPAVWGSGGARGALALAAGVDLAFSPGGEEAGRVEFAGEIDVAGPILSLFELCMRAGARRVSSSAAGAVDFTLGATPGF